ncbi:hypothetical protein EMIT074MI3_11481 [Bacillus licheniformis]
MLIAFLRVHPYRVAPINNQSHLTISGIFTYFPLKKRFYELRK